MSEIISEFKQTTTRSNLLEGLFAPMEKTFHLRTETWLNQQTPHAWIQQNGKTKT